MTNKVAPVGIKGVIANTSTKIKEKAQETKEKWDNLDTKQKVGVIAGGVVVLGGVVYAAYHIAKGKKPTSVELPQHTPKQEKIQRAVEEGNKRADKAIAQYEQGGNYKQIRKEAKFNLDKEGKKVVQERLSEAHSKKVAADIAAEHANIQSHGQQLLFCQNSNYKNDQQVSIDQNFVLSLF